MNRAPNRQRQSARLLIKRAASLAWTPKTRLRIGVAFEIFQARMPSGLAFGHRLATTLGQLRTGSRWPAHRHGRAARRACRFSRPSSSPPPTSGHLPPRRRRRPSGGRGHGADPSGNVTDPSGGVGPPAGRSGVRRRAGAPLGECTLADVSRLCARRSPAAGASRCTV